MEVTARIEGLRPCTQYTFRFLLVFFLLETFSFTGWEAGTSTERRRGWSPSTPGAPLHPPPPPRLHHHLHHRAPRLPSSSSCCSCSPASPSPPSSWSEVPLLCRTEWLSGRIWSTSPSRHRTNLKINYECRHRHYHKVLLPIQTSLRKLSLRGRDLISPLSLLLSSSTLCLHLYWTTKIIIKSVIKQCFVSLASTNHQDELLG